MQVRIGVQSVPKELVVETAQSADEVQKALTVALAEEGGVLVLKDQRGGRVVVPADRIGYLEIGEEENRTVGFATR
ncbi:ATP-binding protein [Actinomadura rubrobrunea]|uniref:ATP-binding protein n=1 Tax=Actinomadura rubrobrunea TaxID=115335 RepID=A0A9W6UV39_9ACTN|nr:DUF3107 domain-containing protein [Actinomadura rubrobrunea]MBX6768834.1 DUF3107 domain-containing protein [Actinomadura rubrobrunea]GLW62300.1 ATP-binding protein [Actinomadura rubrobrunea]